MKYVMETLRQKERQEKLPILRMEIDYELTTLYDAMQAKDTVQMIKSKEKLESLRLQLLKINRN